MAHIYEMREQVLQTLMRLDAEALDEGAECLMKIHAMFPTWMTHRPTLLLASEVFKEAAKHRRHLGRKEDDLARMKEFYGDEWQEAG